MKHFLILLFCLISTLSFSQITRGGAGAFVIGTQILPSEELKAFNFLGEGPELSTANISIGGYGYWQLNSFVIGMKGSGFFSSEQTDERYSYRRGGGMFAVDFGYKVINNDKLSLYPLIGIGGGGMTYSISDRRDVLLDTGENPPIYQGTYSIANVLFDVGVRLEKSFGFESGDCGKGGGMVGLELGYLISPSTDNWKTASGASVVNGPDYSLSGFYIRLLVGGFGGM